MGLLVLIYRYLIASYYTSFYSAIVRTTYLLQDINDPPKAIAQVPLRLQANCIDPKYGRHEYIKVNNNVTIHCVISGNASKPLLMMVHGFPELWYSWRHQILHYQKRYWVVACDLRGFGDSDKPFSVAQYRIEYLVNDLKGVIDSLGRKKALIFGNDWGGIIASRFRETYPGYLIGYIGLSTTSLDAWSYTIWNKAVQRKKSGYFYLYRTLFVPEMRLARNNMSTIERFLLSGTTVVTQDDVECYKYWYGQPGAFTFAVNIYRANFPFTYSKKKYDDGIPSTCALGSKEVALTEDNLAFMNSTYVNMTTAIIQDAEHFMIQKTPDLANAFMDKFLLDRNL